MNELEKLLQPKEEFNFIHINQMATYCHQNQDYIMVKENGCNVLFADLSTNQKIDHCRRWFEAKEMPELLKGGLDCHVAEIFRSIGVK